jgi:hypothetical protein
MEGDGRVRNRDTGRYGCIENGEISARSDKLAARNTEREDVQKGMEMSKD